MPANDVALQSYDLSTEFIEWREMAAGRLQWRAICGSKMPSATKETPNSSRQDIWLSFDVALFPHEYKNLHGNAR
jgi:hypothetical protein